jgi:pyruvate/2-oxoglutarate/acetoin dehydrogenase E1 component
MVHLSLSLSLSLSLALCDKLFSYVLYLLCSMSVVEDSFEYLDAPVERIAGADVPMPYAANLERMAVPQVLTAAALFEQEL